jgi:hypothetical protein
MYFGNMKQWVLIEDEIEVNAIWERFNCLLNFKPDFYDRAKCPFDFSKINEPVVAYDISEIPTTDFEAHNENGNYRTTEQITILKSAFIECMGKDEFLYALDWQHSAFMFNPRNETAYDYYTLYSNLPGARAYYPDFHPDGDYFFFVAKDFSWGYLTHPWQRKVWVYESKLVEIIRRHETKLSFDNVED